jgi:uncharacterized protein YjbI with pentapeptide repeats
MRGVGISGLDMGGIDFSGSKFNNSDLHESSFAHSIFVDVDFSGADLQHAVFTQAQLTRVRFVDADISLASFAGAKFAQMDFSGTDLSQQDLSGANLDHCVFKQANLTGANLKGSSVVTSDFSEAVLESANLSKARLTSGIFEAADLQKANLAGAQMDKANFRMTDLRKADLTKASVKATLFEGAKYNKDTKLPFNANEAKARKMVLIKLFEFSGVMKNTKMSSFDGWKICNTSLYSQDVDMVVIRSACQGGKYLMLACRAKGSDTITLAAYGAYDKVFTDIGSSNTGTVDNGVKFYYGSDWSWGFASTTAELDRDSCDVGTGEDDTRLCFHTNGNGLTGGYRCGAIARLNESNDYERLFLKEE